MALLANHMKSKLIMIGLAMGIASAARADFNPVILTPDSYKFDIVVEAKTPKIVPYCITATSGGGTGEGDYTYFEQTYYAPTGQVGSNMGIPHPNTTFTDISNPNVAFLMPPSYFSNDDLQIDAITTTSGTLTFTTPTKVTSLAILSGGSGAEKVNYQVNYMSGFPSTGTISLSDWLTPNGAEIAWGANGRVTSAAAVQVYSTNSVNNQGPYLYAYYITITSSSAVSSLKFTVASGGEEANFYAVSGKNGGTTYTPIPVTGFNQMTTVPALITSPVTATMDNGTNLNIAGNTWFEQGYYPTTPSDGLPPSGSTFSSVSQSSHHYQMGNYSSNNAILIDANHLSANITPSNPAPYTAFTFLTSGSYIGATGAMTNVCIMQHMDGVKETNQLIGYDWLNTTVAAAWHANGRFFLNLNADYNSSFNNLGNTVPNLFEDYVVISDTNSPVTNIVVNYSKAPATNSTTYIMAVGATAGAVLPVITSGPSPTTQTWYSGQTATITVVVAGTAPITNTWLALRNGVYVTLTNGVDVNGSTVSGATTTTLTISDLTIADGTNYVYLADNVAGQATSIPVSLIVSNVAFAVAPVIVSQNPPASASPLRVFTNLPTEFDITVNAASPPVTYQWYNGANPIPNATNTSYVFSNLDNVTLSCVASNFVGTANSSPIMVSSTLKSPITSPTLYQSGILGYKALAYWPLNETGGSVAYDLVGNNNGTYLGNYTLGNSGITGATGFGSSSSAGFDGSTAYVDIPVNNLNITGPMTVAEWIQTSDANTNVVGDVIGHSDDSYRSGVDADGDPNFADDSPGGLDATGPVSVADGNWHQLVGVYDGTTQYIYVDGSLAGSQISSPPTGSSDDVEIASAPDYANRFFAGYIAQVAIFTNALTASQVSILYGLAGIPPTILTNVPSSVSEVPVGAPMSLSITVGGSAPFYYQWSNQSGAIPGATNSSYSFDAEVGTNSYEVGVSNAYGSVDSATAVVIGSTNPPTIITLDDSSDWTLNSGGAYSSAPAIADAELELTDGGDDEMTSAFYNVVEYIGGFVTSFYYDPTPASGGADGITFCLQNSQSGSSALGTSASGGGGGLGFDAISPAFAFELDIYVHGSVGPGVGTTAGPGIAIGANGSTPYTVTPPPSDGYYGTAPVSLSENPPFYVQLYYMQGVLQVWLIDSTLNEFTTNIVEDVPGIIGGYSAYVGFTGGDGSVVSTQVVSDFSYSYTTPPVLSVVPGATPRTVVVSWSISVSPLFTLLHSSRVNGPWSPADMSSLTQVGLQNQVTLNVGGSTAFYQLQLTAPNAP
jgi:hypothetical protein